MRFPHPSELDRSNSVFLPNVVLDYAVSPYCPGKDAKVLLAVADKVFSASAGRELDPVAVALTFRAIGASTGLTRGAVRKAVARLVGEGALCRNGTLYTFNLGAGPYPRLLLQEAVA